MEISYVLCLLVHCAVTAIIWNDFYVAGFGVEDLSSKILQIQAKKFYLDVKQNKRGRFVKISEVIWYCFRWMCFCWDAQYWLQLWKTYAVIWCKQNIYFYIWIKYETDFMVFCFPSEPSYGQHLQYIKIRLGGLIPSHSLTDNWSQVIWV